MADPQPLLSADKRKLVAKFQQECFEVPDERVLQIAFGVFVLEAEKFEQQRIADFLVSGNSILRFGLFTLEQHRHFVFRQCRAFIKLRVDLPVKLPNRPAARQRFARVKLARVQVPNPQQPDVMRPRQRKGAGNLPRCSMSANFTDERWLNWPISDWPIGDERRFGFQIGQSLIGQFLIFQPLIEESMALPREYPGKSDKIAA